jgi:hypothetical protein
MYAFVLFLCCSLLGSGLATGWSPVQGVLPAVYRLRNWKTAKVHKGCRAIDRYQLISNLVQVVRRFVFGRWPFWISAGILPLLAYSSWRRTETCASAWTTGNWAMSQGKTVPIASDGRHSGHAGWNQMVLRSRSEERLLVGRSASRQEEDYVLDGSGAMAVRGHALWPLQRSNHIWAVNANRLKRPHLRVISRIPGRHDHNWPQVPRVTAQPAENV